MTIYSDSAYGTTARELARSMHADSVDLWNRFLTEAGGSLSFPERAQVEAVQRALTALAYDEPTGDLRDDHEQDWRASAYGDDRQPCDERDGYRNRDERTDDDAPS